MEGLWTPLTHILTTHTPGGGDKGKDELHTNSTSLGRSDGDKQSSKLSSGQKLVEKTTTVDSGSTTNNSIVKQTEDMNSSSSFVDTERPSTKEQTQGRDDSLKLTLNKLVIASPSEVNSAPNASLEDVISFVKELTTPSLETSPLKLPTVPAPFLETQLTTSQVRISTVSHIISIHTCAICGTTCWYLLCTRVD